MKKSQLRKIIKETIKELANEQFDGLEPGTASPQGAWYASFEKKAVDSGTGIVNCTFVNNRVAHWNSKLSNASPNQISVLKSKLNHIKSTSRYNCCTTGTC